MTDNPQTQLAVATDEQIQQWQNHIGTTLEQIYNTADEPTKALVAQAWEKTQGLAQLAQANGIAGAAAIEQRDKALAELQSILDALDKADDTHEHLREFAGIIRDETGEYALDYAFEVTGEELSENLGWLLDRSLQQFDPQCEDDIRNASRFHLLNSMIDAIQHGEINDEQLEAFFAFVKTFWTGGE